MKIKKFSNSWKENIFFNDEIRIDLIDFEKDTEKLIELLKIIGYQIKLDKMEINYILDIILKILEILNRNRKKLDKYEEFKNNIIAISDISKKLIDKIKIITNMDYSTGPITGYLSSIRNIETSYMYSLNEDNFNSLIEKLIDFKNGFLVIKKNSTLLILEKELSDFCISLENINSQYYFDGFLKRIPKNIGIMILKSENLIKLVDIYFDNRYLDFTFKIFNSFKNKLEKKLKKYISKGKKVYYSWNIDLRIYYEIKGIVDHFI